MPYQSANCLVMKKHNARKSDKRRKIVKCCGTKSNNCQKAYDKVGGIHGVVYITGINGKLQTNIIWIPSATFCLNAGKIWQKKGK